MHSRIYQVEAYPVSRSSYLSESDFYNHPFVGSIADYVSDDCNRRQEINAFRQWHEKSGIVVFSSPNCFSILPNGKEIYFQKAFDRFVEAAKELSNATLEDFAGSNRYGELVYTIKSCFCEKFGPYVSSETFETIPLDEFIRQADIGKKYYIGNVLDYHW